MKHNRSHIDTTRVIEIARAISTFLTVGAQTKATPTRTALLTDKRRNSMNHVSTLRGKSPRSKLNLAEAGNGSSCGLPASQTRTNWLAGGLPRERPRGNVEEGLS